MKVSGEIEHIGTVIDANEGRVDVAVEAREACATCKVKGACSMGEAKEKIVTVATDEAEVYKAGDRVVVSVERRMGLRAVWIAYIIPFLLMLATLLAMLELGFSELAAGLSALGILGVYYLAVALTRKKIEREVYFTIKRIE